MQRELVITIDDSLMWPGAVFQLDRKIQTAADVEELMYDAWASTRNYQELIHDPLEPDSPLGEQNPQTKQKFFFDGLISFLGSVVADHTRRMEQSTSDDKIATANDLLAAAVLPGVSIDVRIRPGDERGN